MPRKPAPTHYRLLRVHPAASDEEIRKAFYRLATEYHPDKAATECDRANFDHLIRQVNEAYSVLKTPHSRADHDRLNALRYTPCALCGGTGHRWGVGTDTHVICRECQGVGWWEKDR